MKDHVGMSKPKTYVNKVGLNDTFTTKSTFNKQQNSTKCATCM